MRVHLQYNHMAEYSEVSSKTTPDAQRMPGKVEAGQHSIAEAFEKFSPIPKSSSKWKSLTDSICYCVAKDMVPFNCVNDPGFQYMLQHLNHGNTVYSPLTGQLSLVTTCLRFQVYEKEKTKIVKAIAIELQYFAFTSDGWSS